MHVLVLLLLYMYVNWEDFGASEYMLGFGIIFFLWTEWTQSFFWLFGMDFYDVLTFWSMPRIVAHAQILFI